MPPLAGSINFQDAHSGLGLIPSFRQWLCEMLQVFIFHCDLSMQTHVQRSVAGCFAVLRQLRSIRRDVPSSVYQSLVVALVLSRLDYGNATLAGLPACLLNRLQPVFNMAAQSIAGLRRSEHITDTSTRGHPVQTGSHCLPSSSHHCISVHVRPAAVRC